ncbi:hypothetical protein P9F86_19080 [Bacillus altitudinis]|uniref:hypothetical protein n=1 Tax=Bacillus TaxID=1386 RepID=UPI001072107E|nr:hypothetical protein [Bacillus altitudinis]MBR0579159.1 hypothetical protein [Bacillus altitudinis A23-8]MCY7451712.1 hypothetical protein [Bacillus altitudinis]MEC2040954.1 hypothetical protein [Bacillus altitudinis]MED1423910.1 hypothetical protein [Bacillus altitudinis]QEO61508.1 hypothetical protein EVS87_004675 [Bacillus altitudinis]
MKSKQGLFKNVILITATLLIFSGFSSGVTLSASAAEQKSPKKQVVETKSDLSSQIQSYKADDQNGQIHALGNIDSSEYADRVTVDLDQVLNMQSAQRNVYKKAFQKKDYSNLKDALGASSTILGLLFIANTPTGVVTGVTGLLATIAPSAQAELDKLVKNGYYEMGDLQEFLHENKKYDLIDVQLPFIEYKVNGKRIRFVTGTGVIKRVHSKSGWITL